MTNNFSSDSSKTNDHFAVLTPKVVTIALLIILFLGVLMSLFTRSDFDQYKIKQSWARGEIEVISKTGLIWKGLNKFTTYDISDDIAFEDYNVNVRFNDGSIAAIEGTLKYKMPISSNDRLTIHRDYANQNNVVNDLIIRNLKEVLNNTATLMTAEDSYSSKRADFSSVSEEQIRNGLFAINTTEQEVKDLSGATFIKKSSKIVMENGSPRVIKSSLISKYNIEIIQFVITNIKYDANIEKLIANKKEAEQKRVVAQAEAEKAKQDAITIAEKGKAEIAKAEAEALIEKKKEVVKAQKEKEVAELNAQKSKAEAQAVIEKGRADAEISRLKVLAGLTPLEKATIEKETKIGIAEAIAKVKFPTTMIISGGGKDGGVNPFDAVGLNSLYDLSNKLSKQSGN
jgi:regulator of protease activity HflC (stomatin/prohibitin superfamily)